MTDNTEDDDRGGLLVMLRSAVFSADGGRSRFVSNALDAADGVLDGSAGCPPCR